MMFTGEITECVFKVRYCARILLPLYICMNTNSHAKGCFIYSHYFEMFLATEIEQLSKELVSCTNSLNFHLNEDVALFQCCALY
jgi:hypothetical protein